MNAILSKTIQTAVDATLDQVAAYLVKQNGLFAKKMTKAALLKIINSADSAKTTPAKAGKSKAVAKKDENVPEGWEKKSWAKFEAKLGELEKGHLLNVCTKISNNGKNKKSFVVNEKYHLCAKKGEEDALDAVVSFLDARGGGDDDDDKSDASDKADASDASDASEAPKAKSTKSKAKKDEESDDDADAKASDASDDDAKVADDDEDKSDASDKSDAPDGDDDFIDGYDASTLEKLKKAIKGVAKGDYINVTSRRAIKKTADNEKKFQFDDKRKIAITKINNPAEMKAYVARVNKMLE